MAWRWAATLCLSGVSEFATGFCEKRTKVRMFDISSPFQKMKGNFCTANKNCLARRRNVNKKYYWNEVYELARQPAEISLRAYLFFQFDSLSAPKSESQSCKVASCQRRKNSAGFTHWHERCNWRSGQDPADIGKRDTPRNKFLISLYYIESVNHGSG